MSKQKWEVKSHSTGPDISGEYDGYWEIVNEKGAALRTTDDYEDIESDLNCIANMLNDLDLSVETALEINLHCETQLQKMEIETLKAENSKMRQALEWTKLEPGQPLPEKRIRVHAWDGLIIWEAFIDFDGKWKWMYAEERGEAHQETNTITHWRPIGLDPVATEALKTP